ncbi:hypothetical protein X777_04273 [Ooceraea biroi]|uniref:Uncharacterized protein n=1 Tax=Ooceraea biroi TaxID=2015173 RepID=A0A026WK48_OOCBI|nr:hypothetical protein X777_04273 [Ooceraea biroi]
MLRTPASQPPSGYRRRSSSGLNRCGPSYPIKRGDSARLNAVTNTDTVAPFTRSSLPGGRRGKRRRFSPPPGEQFDLLSRTGSGARGETRWKAQTSITIGGGGGGGQQRTGPFIVPPINCYVTF